MTRPTLHELARERGYSVSVYSPRATGARWLLMAHSTRVSGWWDSPHYGNLLGPEVRAPTRRAAEAGLRAALLAMPKRKEKKR